MKRLLVICIALVALTGLLGVVGFLTGAARLTSQIILFGSLSHAVAQIESYWENALWMLSDLVFGAAQIWVAVWAFNRLQLETVR